MFYNLTWSDSKYSCLLLAQEWLERHYFNGTKVQWFSLMHGNGCQQAFSFSTTIRALSLVSGRLASYHTELQCCQVPHLWGWQHITIPKISEGGSGTEQLMHTAYSKTCYHWLTLCAYPVCLCGPQNHLRPREQTNVHPLTFVLTLHWDVHIKTC